jgi:hypothetical protein
MRLGILPIVIVFTSLTPIVAQELPVEKLEDIAAIGYKTIDFSTTCQQFVNMYPNARLVDTESVGTKLYFLPDADGKMKLVSLQFLDDELLSITFHYDSDRISQYGGTQALLERAIQRFGDPTKLIDGGAIWELPAIDRRIAVGEEGDAWMLFIWKRSVQQSLEARQAQLDAGF